MTSASPESTTAHRDPAAAQSLAKQARTAEQKMDRRAAIDLYRKAHESNPDDAQVAFRLAYNLDLVGEEDEALELYELACGGDNPPLNALMNLAIMYEDRGYYTKAERCLRMVVDTNPNHHRARLYLKDVLASRGMYIDEDSQKQRDKHTSLLDTPVTDFELSARARNCLKKMNVRTLGDLLRISEGELLAYKNFGETTLMEIKGMLSQKGLKIGQGLGSQHSAARDEVYEQLRQQVGDEGISILERPVDDLELSVRARKALDLLNIQTIGDLAARTEAELLGIKNFGQTSLDEIHEKLAEHGLKLRTLSPEE